MNKTSKHRVYTITIMIVTVTAIAKMIMITTMIVISYNTNYIGFVSLSPGCHSPLDGMLVKHRLFPSFFQVRICCQASNSFLITVKKKWLPINFQNYLHGGQ